MHFFNVALSLVFFTAPADAASLSGVGVKIGSSYDKAKSKLVKDGWKALIDGEGVSKKYPEISCGQGRDAICSAGFSKAKDQIAIVVAEKGKGYVVSGEY